MMKCGSLLLSVVAVLAGGVTCAAQQPPAIHLNQIGFHPEGEKIAVVVGATGEEFRVVREGSGEEVFTGRLGEGRSSEVWGAPARLAEFSALRDAGSYRVVVPGMEPSPAFEVRRDVHEEVAQGSLKAFYFHRVSAPVLAALGGAWSRPAGHPDTRVAVHPSAASPDRPAGSLISSPGGWYDAGDYNKYIVNSGITTGTLLAVLEEFPEAAADLDVGIPESGNGVPDLLDEALWNFRWMLTMQDAADGGVYHKLTTARFSGMVMPVADTAQRYVVQKSTAAALNLAAVAAQASRVLRRYPSAAPGLADSALTAAVRAWGWARRNPEVRYNQNAINEQYDPDVVTGAYGDGNLADEFAWAAVELYATTREDSFLAAVPVVEEGPATVPSWNSVRTLGYFTLARLGSNLQGRGAGAAEQARARLIAAADSLLAPTDAHPYRAPMGANARDFVWGSSGVAANQGMLLVAAHRITGEPRYLRGAVDNLDYLLGRNPTGYSFLTGFGDRTPMHPHHRPSEADGVEAPVPGWLSGGPNPGRQDGCQYASTVPALAFTDDVCSYASNEVAINWNAPFVYLTVAVEGLMR